MTSPKGTFQYQNKDTETKEVPEKEFKNDHKTTENADNKCMR